MPAEFLLVLGMGLLGSAHCVGMCGGFAVLAHTGRGASATLSWLSGKAVTYAALGAVAGGVGHLFSLLRSAQTGLTLFVGVILILLGLASAGILPDRLPLVGSLGPRLGRLMGRTVRSGPFVLGLVNGLLPCGLVYAAVAYAASTGTVPAGAAVMAVFGAATVPSLAITGWAATRVGPAIVRRAARAGGWLVVALGVVTLWRAWMMHSAGSGAHGMA